MKWYPKMKPLYIKTTKQCADCGLDIRRARKYCAECATARQKDKDKRLKRNELINRQPKEYINKEKVFISNKWRCQMCKISTPKRLMGTIDDRAPTLDHIIPVSKGGLHLYSNVQLLCRKCNCSIKRDKVIVLNRDYSNYGTNRVGVGC